MLSCWLTRCTRSPSHASNGRAGLSYYFRAAITAVIGWTSLIAFGVLLGGLIPGWVPLELAIPLTFVLLALPLIKDSAGLVAASVGGIAALIADPLPFGAGIIVGAVAGLIAGGVVLATKAPPASPTTEEVIADA